MVVGAVSVCSTFENLELAGRIVDTLNKLELQPFDIALKLDLRRNAIASLSGLTEFDYITHDGFRDVVPLKTIPIPQELLDQFSHMRCNCAMGLLADVSRAWFSVDSDLYIWNYETGCDLAYYDKLEYSVLQVCLVSVRPGLFQSHIHRLLCVITSVDLLLLAVNFSDSNGQSVHTSVEYNHAEMHLLPECVFRVSLDGLVVSHVQSTKNGRIFLAGRDSSLYEIQYKNKSWFGNECKKINHSKGVLSYMLPSFVSMTFGHEEPLAQIVIDDSRNILFTRSDQGSIQVFDLGADGDCCTQVTHLSSSYIQDAAVRCSQSIEPTNFRPIVHLQVVESSSSRVINLIATTHSAVRFYFTCYYPDSPSLLSSPINILQQDQCRPQTLRLIHVRLPPGFSATSTVSRPNNTHLSLSDARDVSAFVTMAGETNDIGWFMQTLNPFHQSMSESLVQYSICGRTWDISDGTFDTSDYFSKLWQKCEPKSVSLPLPALLVRQHLHTPRKVVLLTAQAIQMWLQLRPVDVLKNILLEYGPESKQLNAFFKLHQTEQSMNMCILLACTAPDVSERAMRAFFVHCGHAEIVPLNMSRPMEQSFINMSNIGSPALASTPVQSPYNYNMESINSVQQPHIQQQQQQQQQQQLISQQQQQHIQQEQHDVRFSASHNALYSYFTRLIGPLWNMKIANYNMRYKPTDKKVTSVFTSKELSWLCDQMLHYKSFFTKYQVIPPPLCSGNENRARVPNANNRQNQAEALNLERQSLLRLQDLVCMSCEVLELWRILVEHDFSTIVLQLPDDLFNLTVSVTFRQLLVQGKDLCADLITCLIRHYLTDEAKTDTICDKLRETCPSLFTLNDAVIAKASEFLQNATREENGMRKEELVRESVRLFKKVANQIHLPTVVKQFEEGQFFVEIVDLSLCTAQKLDPENLACLYIENDDNTSNSKLEQAYLLRLSCYKCIIEALDRLLSPNAWQDSRLTPQLAEVMSEQMLKDCIDSGDYLCHMTLFQWMLDKGLDEKLLHMQCDDVELFLKNGVSLGGSQALRYLDLLCKLLEKKNSYLSAAKMLIKMAETPQTCLDLDSRLAYVTRACMCAKSVPFNDSPGLAMFIQQLQDKLEIGRLQKQVLSSIESLGVSSMTRDSISQLNAELFDVSTLYESYAERFNLPECKLSIIHCAGHDDSQLIHTIWNEIMESIVNREGRAETNENKLNRLKMKIIALAKVYASSPKYFPHGFIIGRVYLECERLGAGVDWLSGCLIQCGIPPQLQVQVLMELYKSRHNRMAQSHLMGTISYAIDNFIAHATNMDSIDRRKAANRLLDVTSYFLVELDALPVDQQFSTYKSSFKGLQMKIQRLA